MSTAHTLVLPHPAFESALRAEALKKLHELYAEIDRAQAAFLEGFTSPQTGPGRPSCPSGCGACCEGFVPDILPLEADYLALWLMPYHPQGLALPSEGPPPCPFYVGSGGRGQCGVYPARPLICRLFGYSAIRNKAGEPSYSLCKTMPGLEGLDERSWSGPRLGALSGAKPPLMADFAERLIALAPAEAERRELIIPALSAALSRLYLWIRYHDDDDDEPPNPAPAAA